MEAPLLWPLKLVVVLTNACSCVLSDSLEFVSIQPVPYIYIYIHRKVSDIRCTKCQNLNESHLILQLSVPNPLKPSVKSIMKM